MGSWLWKQEPLSLWDSGFTCIFFLEKGKGVQSQPGPCLGSPE